MKNIKQSKSSAHYVPVKTDSEIHNQRQREMPHVRNDLSAYNQNWGFENTISEHLQSIKENYENSVGQRMQAKATPIKEACINIKESTTMADLQQLAKEFEYRFGIKTFQISIHKDEGAWVIDNPRYDNTKPADDNNTPYKTVTKDCPDAFWKPNYHAHFVSDFTKPDGKSLGITREQMSELQDITAEVLGMECGQSSNKKHQNSIAYKNQLLEKQLQETQEKLQQETIRKEQLFDTVEELQQECKNIEIQKSLKQFGKRVLDIFGKDSEKNILKSDADKYKTLYLQLGERSAQKEQELNEQIIFLRDDNKNLSDKISQKDKTIKSQHTIIVNIVSDLFKHLWHTVEEKTPNLFDWAQTYMNKFPSDFINLEMAMLGIRQNENRLYDDEDEDEKKRKLKLKSKGIHR